MKAHARVVACRDAAGATVLAELRGEAPLLPRATGARGGPVAEVHLVGGAAGPLGGDELVLSLVVGPGASLVLRTVAASVALPGPRSQRSTLTVEATVAKGGSLCYLPEPTVAAAGCDHLILSTVELAADAQLRWREELVAGRHGEAGGDLTLRTRVRRAGAPLYHQDLAVGPRALQWAGPAVLGGNRAAGSVLLVDGAARLPATVDGGSLMPLAVPGAWLATVVAPAAHELRRTLDMLCESARA
jgi:urease accessory protein